MTNKTTSVRVTNHRAILRAVAVARRKGISASQQTIHPGSSTPRPTSRLRRERIADRLTLQHRLA